MLPISVCIIAKNEEKYIETCLQKLSRYDWEIIVTDTGSTDHTIEIAKKYTDHVYSFQWIHDFSAARNFCISKASNDWILNIDCDEYLTNTQSKNELQKLLAPLFCNPENVGIITITNPLGASSDASSSIEPVARFFHKAYYHYEGIVHEQPFPLKADKLSYMQVPLTLYHEGYSDKDILQKKSSRNILLLKESLQNTPEDAYLYFQLGQSYFVIENYQEACNYFEKGLSIDVDPQLQYVQNMVEAYGHCLLRLKRYEQALSLEGVYETFCTHADFVFLMGLIYMNNAMFDKAIQHFEVATKIQNHSISGINSYLAYYNIGVIYECSGQTENARKYYKKCGSYQPALSALKRLP